MAILQSDVRNGLLSALEPDDFEALAPHLALSASHHRRVLLDPGDKITDVHFLESGIASFIGPADDQTEVGLIGREGMIGLPAVLEVDRSPLRVTVQIPGECLTIPTETLQSMMEARPALRRVLLRYAHVLHLQTVSMAYASAHCIVEERLARWLLVVRDRIDGDELRLTHDFLSGVLGVRRPGVTVAIHVLEGEHAIRSRRGSLVILDRGKLIERAGSSYGLAEAEYERLIGRGHHRRTDETTRVRVPERQHSAT